MTSLMAREVALDSIKAVGKGKKPNIYKSSLKHGYSYYSAKANKATSTKTYQNIMSDFIGQMKKIKARNLKNLEEAVIKNEKNTMRDLAYVDDLMTKNINLLEGKATEISEDVTEIKTAEEAKEYLKKVLNE